MFACLQAWMLAREYAYIRCICSICMCMHWSLCSHHAAYWVHHAFHPLHGAYLYRQPARSTDAFDRLTSHKSALQCKKHTVQYGKIDWVTECIEMMHYLGSLKAIWSFHVFSHRFIHRLGKLLGITAYFIWKSLFLLKSKIIQQIITFRCLVLGAENFVPGLDPTSCIDKFPQIFPSKNNRRPCRKCSSSYLVSSHITLQVVRSGWTLHK